ncbi:hypothetical protein Slin15195_G042050 [Septoria linicola]|uniref:Uncharacterized protein n=1 Tax=Septoria linicola TaxID=215465 RepID=A0A9Q9ARV6_9PEZI|nr:hypothetical protein Slin14017_G045560 [Septoria linicola]USW50886.1 hypothetical protein Slin15195_G042050 [Septoria linicola]
MFFLKTTLTTLATLASSAQALYFHLEPFSVSDVRIPSESHSISFTINNPTAVFEQGGSSFRNCSIAWTGCNVPTCWTSCQSDGLGPSYYARVEPESYNGAYDFSLEVEEYFVYRNSGRYNATIPVAEGSGGYRCSRGGQSTVCGYWGEPAGVNSNLTATYSVGPRDNVCQPAGSA